MDSISSSGLAVEVGPLSHGIDYEILCSHVNTFVVDDHAYLSYKSYLPPLCAGTISYELLDHSRQLVLAALDFIEAHNQRLLKISEDNGVPVRCQNCYHSVVSPQVALPSPCPVLQFYQRLHPLKFPQDKNGKVTGFISPAFDRKDWCAVNPGDAVFVTIDGTTLPLMLPEIPFKGPPWMPAPTIQRYAMFINEGKLYLLC